MPLDPSIPLQVLRPDQIQASQLDLQGKRNEQALQPYKVQVAQQTAQTGQLDLANKKIDTTLQLLGTVHDQASLDMAHQQAAALGIDSNNFTKVYDPITTPQQINQIKMQLTPYKDQIMAQLSGMRLSALNGGMFDPVGANPAPATSPVTSNLGLSPSAAPAPGSTGQPLGLTPPIGSFTNTLTKPQPATGDGMNDTLNYLSANTPPVAFGQTKMPPSQSTMALASPGPLIAPSIPHQGMTDDELKKLGYSQDALAVARATAEGDSPWPTGRVAASPAGAKLIALIKKMDPQASANTATALKAFNTGPQGNKVRSFNVALSHLDVLDKLGAALDNGDLKGFNALANSFAAQTGETAPTNFNSAKQIVGNEIVNAIVGGGGSDADRDKAQSALDAANSPAQLKEAIATIKQLMSGQLSGLRQQYNAATGRKDFETRLLTPEARAQLQGNQNPAQDSSGGNAPAANFKFLGFK